jgi:hypothetical protein
MHFLRASVRLAVAFLGVGLSMSLALSQTGQYQLIHDFGATPGDGTGPYGGVTIGSGGNVYGTCCYGGLKNVGMVWEIDQAGNYQDLHDFGVGSDGYSPLASVAIDAAGNLYGTCDSGGNSGYGMAWEIDTSGDYHDLHDFGGGSDGRNPTASVTIDTAGDMYGTCEWGGTNRYGMVWEIDASGNYHDLHNFGAGTDGVLAQAGVTIDSAGNLYGTCIYGGLKSAGMVWEIDTSSNYHDLHDFGVGTDGANSVANVTVDSAGNLYGTCVYGGLHSTGIVWQIDTSSNYHDLHDFGSGTDGAQPEATVTIDLAGNLYGTCELGGSAKDGMIWEIDNSASYHDLHDFGTGTDGIGPLAGVTIDSAGQMYGTCFEGGSDRGVFWQIAIGGPALSGFSTPQSALGSTTVSCTVSLAGTGTLFEGRTVQITSDNSAIPSASVTVPVGATEASIALQCGSVTSETTVHLTASKGSVTVTSTIVLYPGLASLVLSPASVLPGEPCNGTLTLNLPAPPGGWVVQLSSNDSKVGVPSPVTVPEGNSSASFPVTLPIASLGETAEISASDADVTLTQNLNVMALYTSGISISPSLVYGGTTATGTITLNTATPSGFTVKLASQYPTYVGIPATVTIPANATSATFQITTKAAANGGTYASWINASDAVASKKATITVQTAHVIQLSLTPSTIAGGSGVTGHVYLNVPAPSGGLLVNLASQYPNLVGVPTTVTIPMSLTSATFAITTKATSGTYGCVIKSTDPIGSQIATLTVVSP